MEGDFKDWKHNRAQIPKPDICMPPKPRQNPSPDSFCLDPDYNQMSLRVVDVAHYKNPDDLVDDVIQFNPTVVFISWCYRLARVLYIL